MKSFLKSILGRIRCFLYGISYSGRVYIGKHVNIIGGHNIRLSEDVCIRPEVDIWVSQGTITIGKGSEIGQRNRISIMHSMTIGENVLLSANVYVTDCDHAYENPDIPVIKQGIVDKNNTVTIGDGSYIGINTVIVGNVHIGKHCVIGANSVVTKEVPDYCVATGAPAKIIKKFDFNTKQWERIDGIK